MGRRKRAYTDEEIRMMIHLVKGEGVSYQEASERMRQIFHKKYSASQINLKVREALGQLPTHAVNSITRLVDKVSSLAEATHLEREINEHPTPTPQNAETPRFIPVENVVEDTAKAGLNTNVNASSSPLDLGKGTQSIEKKDSGQWFAIGALAAVSGPPAIDWWIKSFQARLNPSPQQRTTPTSTPASVPVAKSSTPPALYSGRFGVQVF